MKKINTLYAILGSLLLSWAPAMAQEDTVDEVVDDVAERGRGPSVIRNIVKINLENFDFSDELEAKISDFQSTQEELRNSLQEEIDALVEPTLEEIRTTTEAFKEANQEEINAQKALAREIREELAAYRRENAPERPEIDEEVLQARQDFNDLRDGLAQDRRTLKEALAAAETEEERQQLIADFRAGQRETLQEMKEIRRTIRNELRDGDNDRRGGGGG